MQLATRVTEMLGITYPIIQAPMAGGITTPQLVAAVAAAGALGSFGAGYQSPADLRMAIRAVRQQTDRPFAVNLFTPELAPIDLAQIERIQAVMQPYRAELGIAPPPPPSAYAPNFEEQIAVVIEERVPIFSFAFGIPAAALLLELKRRGVILVGTATTVREAVALEAAGVDLIVAQGSEAGGHRGAFLGDPAAALVGTLALVPQAVDSVRAPVIAAGGIMDGRGLAAALALGAGAVQMGTAFLPCPESGAHQRYKQAVLESDDEATGLTVAFSGKPARGIANRFSIEMAAHAAAIPAYPVQNVLTRDIRQTAAQQNRPDLMSLWAGQATCLSRALPAAQLVAATVAEAEATLRRLGGQ